MRPLTQDDLRTIGEHRTLARLGAGGMGVVYLARSPGGALAADPGFRTRFRRETEAARRVTGPWVVPVTGADPEAREPWLATAFVPGPSLAEAVAIEGPLPETTVRLLGARLAGALAAVHDAGLVHRDVKPGNVLLALDGPRLIDFGIARHEGATALTATDAVIGTPGYLAPEQASAGPLGPACDLFSLGCVLVYAATGRRPFGQGNAASVLFRTVHEEPDLNGLPPGLLPLVASCLAKNPADRPTARQVEQQLTAATDHTVPTGTAGPTRAADDAHTAARSWAPAGLSALIAERATAALALPTPEPPTVVTDTDPGPPRPARRRVLTAAAAVAVLLAGGGTAVRMMGRQRHEETTTRTLPTYTVGLHADLTGPGRAVGVAHERGVRIAVADHNSRAAAAGFRLSLRTEDDGGDATRALRVADRLAADPKVLAVIGPTGNIAENAVVSRYEKARLAQVVVAAGSTTAESSVTKTLCVTRHFDSVLPNALTRYVTVRSMKRLVVVEDRADPQAGWSIANHFRDTRFRETEVTVRPVATDSASFAPAARAAVAAGADAVVYAGSSPVRGARCALALADAGFTGTGMSVGPVLAPAFRRDAGRAAEGWVFAEAYTDPPGLPTAKAFTAAYRRRFGTAPARWAAEAYDAVGLIARAVRSTSAEDAERGGVVQRLFLTRHPGITRTLSFRPNREVEYETGMFLYRIEGGQARFLGPYEDV